MRILMLSPVVEPRRGRISSFMTPLPESKKANKSKSAIQNKKQSRSKNPNNYC